MPRPPASPPPGAAGARATRRAYIAGTARGAGPACRRSVRVSIRKKAPIIYRAFIVLNTKRCKVRAMQRRSDCPSEDLPCFQSVENGHGCKSRKVYRKVEHGDNASTMCEAHP